MSSSIAPVEERHNTGIGILLLSQLVLIFLDTLAKWMATQGIPTGEIVFMRYAVHVRQILAIVWPLRGKSLFETVSTLDR
jgi:hypothetical protein